MYVMYAAMYMIQPKVTVTGISHLVLLLMLCQRIGFALFVAPRNRHFRQSNLFKEGLIELAVGDKAQGARSAVTETYQYDRRGYEHRAT